MSPPARGRPRRRPSAALSVRGRARRIRLLLLDVDGVLTDGRIHLQSFPGGGGAEEMKVFFSQDGVGLKLARAAGLRTGLITGRESAATARRARETEMEFVWQKRAEKLPAYEAICLDAGVGDAEVAYMGDDLPDLPVLERVGLAIAPANAVPEVKRAAHYVTLRRGGEGAVREAIEMILKARGAWRGVIGRARA
ncbi:MAG TPA: HAD hydrolase family protein [Candidatus Acidoferrales bacterium]|nr:HAD hydrolase family protein [Candidatus Acidoferrales bacterium]